MQRKHFYIDDENIEFMKKAAKEKGFTHSDLIRRMIEFYKEHKYDKEKKIGRKRRDTNE